MITNRNRMISKDISDLPGVASRLLEAFPESRIFAFYGAMGAGKTTFIKALCAVLDVQDTVSSPTFAIVNVYKTSGEALVNHFDCYRMRSAEEAYDIGYEDYFYSGDYCFIEWPEIIEQLIPEDAVKVRIEVNEESGFRMFSF